MIAFKEAVAIVRSEAKPLGREHVPIADAHRRVLADEVRAMVTAPPRDVSAMDGYAVREKDLGGFPVRLRVIEKSFPGDGHVGRIGAGEYMRIFTGAPVPATADRVIIQEMVRREGDTAVIEASPGAARHIRARGADFAAGALLLPAGRLLDYRALVAAAGADADVGVIRRVVLGQAQHERSLCNRLSQGMASNAPCPAFVARRNAGARPAIDPTQPGSSWIKDRSVGPT